MINNKIIGWMMVLGLLLVGDFKADAQRTSGESRKNWEIIVTNSPILHEGQAITINSRGTFSKVETKDGGKTNNRTSKVLKVEDVQRIGELLQKLNLAQTTSEATVGKGENNHPYRSFSIEIGGRGYMIEGEFISNIPIRVLTNEQKAVLAELKAKLNEIGIPFPTKADVASVNSLNLLTGFSLPLIPAEQKMLFRFEYWKRNDGFQHKGWYMDESGKVYKYSYDLAKNPQNPNSFDFSFKMLPTLFAQAKPEELTKLRELLTKVERGKYTEKEVAVEKGTAEISAFLPNSETGKYREVRLASIGDVEGINDAPETEELIVFLKSIVPAD